MDKELEERNKKFIADWEKWRKNFDVINGYVERGETIPEEYTKNPFLFPLEPIVMYKKKKQGWG